MADSPKIELKDPRIAAVLAFLIPGLGHFYQGRTFKGAIYSVCILGTFFAGMVLGDWKVVYFNWGKKDRIIPPICQFWNGLPFLPAVIQARRTSRIQNPAILNEATASEFTGDLNDITSTVDIQGGTITGRLEIEPQGRGVNHGFNGQFQGLLLDKHPIAGKVHGVAIDPKIAPFPKRHISFDLIGTIDLDGRDMEFNGQVYGAMPRSVFDWYAAPLHDNRNIVGPGHPTDLEVANDYLGRFFDLGTLYTMIAGLLNILAIYDAYEGPAYGHGEDDEDDDEDDDAEQPQDKSDGEDAPPA